MKNNLFANGLLVTIGILMLLAAMQMFGWGRGTDSLEAEAFDLSELNQLDINEADSVAVIDDKAIEQITDAPLFSMDRTPYVAPAEGSELEETEIVEEPDPLQAKVTSIIITDENSYAMVFDELSRERVTLKKGMPLPGDQGLWVVGEIKPRMVTFVADGEEPVELELEVFSGQLNKNAAKNRSVKKTKNRKGKNNNSDSNNQQAQKNSAEEIRRKIAERRAQMRAKAAKGNKE